MEKDDGVELPFTLNLCKLPAELINDCFALAYIIPAHDEINKDGSPEKNDMQRISEECSTVVEEKQLRNRMKDVVNASLDPMLALTNDGKIVVANAAAVNSFGEFVGQNIKIICNKHDAKHHDAHLQRYLSTGEKRVIGRKRELDRMERRCFHQNLKYV